MKDSLQGPKNNNHDIIVAANIKNTVGRSADKNIGGTANNNDHKDDKTLQDHQSNQ